MIVLAYYLLRRDYITEFVTVSRMAVVIVQVPNGGSETKYMVGVLLKWPTTFIETNFLINPTGEGARSI